jgi:tetratricopeptide (TPR) repeat protein
VLAGIDAWIAAKPQSAHARVARANYHFATAWRRRGTNYIRNTPPERIQGMIESGTRAIEDAVAALQIDSTHLIAYDIAIGVSQLAGRHDEASRLMQRGLSIHRGSFILYQAFMAMLWPRWGGSEQAMLQLAARAAQDADLNPRLATLRGAVFRSRAYDSTLAGNHTGAVRELNKALGYGYERIYIAARGKEYYRLGAYEYAFNDLRTAVMERSQDADILEFYGRTLIELAPRARAAIRPTILARAVEVLSLAAYLEPDNADARAALARAQQMSRS